jgi:ACS family glucarate transporter-like MFS transporter
MLGFAFSAAALVALMRAESAEGAILCFAVAAFGADMTISPSWVFCADIAGAKAGGVSGAMNMLGNLGSFVSANAFPFLHGLTGSASAYFLVAALINVGAMFCWFRMTSLEREDKP